MAGGYRRGQNVITWSGLWVLRMEALEKSPVKRMKSGGYHGGKGSPGRGDQVISGHQQVRLRIKLPVSPPTNASGPPKASSSAPVAINQEPALSDSTDRKSSDTAASPTPEEQNFTNTSLKELRVSFVPSQVAWYAFSGPKQFPSS